MTIHYEALHIDLLFPMQGEPDTILTNSIFTQMENKKCNTKKFKAAMPNQILNPNNKEKLYTSALQKRLKR